MSGRHWSDVDEQSAYRVGRTVKLKVAVVSLNSRPSLYWECPCGCGGQYFNTDRVLVYLLGSRCGRRWAARCMNWRWLARRVSMREADRRDGSRSWSCWRRPSSS